MLCKCAPHTPMNVIGCYMGTSSVLEMQNWELALSIAARLTEFNALTNVRLYSNRNE
jgi:hypothetical protein